MNEIKLLQQLGLSKSQSAIYLELLSHPHLSVTDLARETGLQRTIVYRTLPLLLEQGLVTEVPYGKRKHYCANAPDKLKRMSEDVFHKVNELIPTLEERVSDAIGKPVVTVHQGKKAIQDALIDIVETLPLGGIFYRYRPSVDSLSEKKYITKKYRELRDGKNIQRYWISSSDDRATSSRALNRIVRLFLDKDEKDFHLNQYIYGDKVSFMDFESQTAIIIEHAMIAEFQKQLFMMTFRLLPQQQKRS